METPRIEDLGAFQKKAKCFPKAKEMFEYMSDKGKWVLTVYPYEKLFVYTNSSTDEKVYMHYWRYKDTEIDIRGDNTRHTRPPEFFPIEKEVFTFADLFSGIGGFRLALEKLGGVCVGFSEINKRAKAVYKKNFKDFPGMKESDLGDIRGIDRLPIGPDLIVGGVPCQPWSSAGKRKGFDDPRGRLWADTLRVVHINKPKAFIFENVKGLVDPRNKDNFDQIMTEFTQLNYTVKAKVLNSYDYGLPQNRDRVFLVGIRKDLIFSDFVFPEPVKEVPRLWDIFDDIECAENYIKKKFKVSELFNKRIPVSRNRFQKDDELSDFFTFSDVRNGNTTFHSWDFIETTAEEMEICYAVLNNRRKKRYGNAEGNPLSFEDLRELLPDIQIKHLSNLVDKGILRYIEDKGFGFVNSKNSGGINGINRFFLPQSVIFSTLTATGSMDVIVLETIKGDSIEEYRRNFIEKIYKKKKYRALTGREYGRLQGFPDDFITDEKEEYARKQFGNAVSVPVVYHLAKSLIDTNVFEDFVFPFTSRADELERLNGKGIE